MEDAFASLLERVKRLTGLDGRDAAKVAVAFDDTDPLPQQIIEKAQELGFDVQTATAPPAPESPTFGVGISMNPVEVLTETYMVAPRVLMQHIPKIGKVPDEARKYFDHLDELPEDVRAMLVKIDVFEGQATFWLKDEANDVDRPIGPIDLKPYGEDLEIAFRALVQRLPLILSADCN